MSDLKSSSAKDTVCSEIAPKAHAQFERNTNSNSKPNHQTCRAESRQQARAMGSEEKLSTNLDLFQEGLSHGQRTPCREEQQQPQNGSYCGTGETESKAASPADSAWLMEGREMVQASEPQNPVVCLPLHEHWLHLSSDTESSNGWSHSSKLSSLANGDCKDPETSSVGIPCGPSPSRLPTLVKTSVDSGCCSCSSLSNTAFYQPVSDQEWIQIFRPVKGEGGTRCRAFSSSPQAGQGIKRTKSKRLRYFAKHKHVKGILLLAKVGKLYPSCHPPNEECRSS